MNALAFILALHKLSFKTTKRTKSNHMYLEEARFYYKGGKINIERLKKKNPVSHSLLHSKDILLFSGHF